MTPARDIAAEARDSAAEAHIVESLLGRHLYIADGSRIYDMPEDGADIADILAALAPEHSRRIGAEPLGVPPLQTLSLNIAQACNMSCGYCYADEGKFGAKAKTMPEPIAFAAVDRLFCEARPHQDLVIGFMGGEPLLARPLIHAVVAHARAKAEEDGRRVRFSLTTNATLLRAGDVAFFAANDFHIAVSIDGARAANDAARPFASGAGSYDKVVAALGLFERHGFPRHLSARATVTARSGALMEALDHLIGLGFNSVGFSPVLVSPDPSLAFSRADFDHFCAQMIACGTKARAAIVAGRAYPFSNFETALQELHRGSHRPYPCGAGAAYLSVDAKGDFYACHRLVGDAAHAMGNIRVGSDVAARAAHLIARHVDKQEPCKSCWARYLCGGGCYHEVDRRGRPACDYIRAWLDFCIGAYVEILDAAPDYFAAPESFFPAPARARQLQGAMP